MAKSDNKDRLPVDELFGKGPTLAELDGRVRQEFEQAYPERVSKSLEGRDYSNQEASSFREQSRNNEWPNPGIPEEPVVVPDPVHPFRMIDASSGGNKVKISAGSKLFDETGSQTSVVSITDLDTAKSISSGDEVWIKATISGLSITAAVIEVGSTYTGYPDQATFSGGAQNFAFRFIGQILASDSGVVDPIEIGTVYGRQLIRSDLQAVVGAYDGQAAVLLRPF